MSKPVRSPPIPERYAANVHPLLQSPRLFVRNLLRVAVVLALLFTSQSSSAYSVLTHEQVVDLLWKAQIRPMLVARFPDATDEQIHEAHAYAYGGALIQDIGYYPFGNHFFSDLVHYVRSGDFVTNMLAESLESNDIDQYAFALGALAHYASDIAGHPAVNTAVADQFPKLRAKFGDSVTYADNHSAHIRTEFGFDVVQVARDRFTSQAFHDFIGFEVSKPLLQKAFLTTYGVPIEDIFPNLDLAIGTFRYSVSRLIPQMTRVAIVMKKDEILKEDPTMTRKRFLYHLKTSQYRHDFGKQYQRPNLGDRILAFFLSILPKIGPLKTLDFKVPTGATETLYMQSVNDSETQLAHDLALAASKTLQLENKDFDTGRETKAGEYSLTDDSYADLLGKLADHHFAQVTPELKANILDFYRDPKPPAFAAKSPRRWTQALANLAQLRALQPAAVEPLASR
jgi:hypothetical protein